MKWQITSEHFSAVSSYYQERPWVTANEIRHQIVDFVGKIEDVEYVLDIGIGTGEFSRLLGIDPSKLIGVDIASGMLQEARARLGVKGLIMADAHCLPFRDACADLVICRNVLRHSYDPLLLIQEAGRVCKSTGRVIMAENCAANEEDQIFLDKIISVAEPFQYPFRTPKGFHDLFIASGFSEVRFKTFSHLQIASMDYFRTHYRLDEQKATSIWQMFESVPEEFRQFKQLHKRKDGSYTLLSHWIIIEGKLNAEDVRNISDR